MGYAVTSNRELHADLISKKEPWTINTLAAKSAEVMINDEEYLQDTRNFIKDEIAHIISETDKIDWFNIYIPSVNFFLCKIMSGMTADELRGKLIKDKILIRDASNFKFLDETFIRLAIKDRDSNNKLLEALRNI